MARIAGSERELVRILEDLESWSRKHEMGPLAHFLSALRARAQGVETPGRLGARRRRHQAPVGDESTKD